MHKKLTAIAAKDRNKIYHLSASVLEPGLDSYLIGNLTDMSSEELCIISPTIEKEMELIGLSPKETIHLSNNRAIWRTNGIENKP